MGAVHVRTPKNFVLEERLEHYADAIETNPEAYAGDWRKACAPVGSKPFEHLHLDLGCGKGTYLVERAVREPNTLFIGMDQEPICIAYAAQKICEQELPNALVLPRGCLLYTSPPELDRLPYSLLYHQTMSTLASTGELTPAELAQRVLTLSYFHRVSADDYRVLLRHLIKIDHIQVTEGGRCV